MTKLKAQMASAMSLDLKRGITRFKKKVDVEGVYQAWLSGNWHKVNEFIPWNELPEDISGASLQLGKAVEAGADSGISVLPPLAKTELRFDLTNPRLRNYVATRTGQLVVNINDQTQRVIANAISRSLDEAMTPRRVADLIRPSIGLYPGQVTALHNYRIGLEKGGASPKHLEQLSSAYEEKLLDYRSMMIARTETSFAVNEAQDSVWDTAADQGLFDKSSATKEWVTASDPCPECIDLEDQGAIPFEEDWESEDGPVDSPPLHPNCYCSVTLNFGE